MYLVSGATGNVGREVARELLAAGHRVRALVRNTAAQLPDGAEAVTGDLDNPDSLTAALEGVTGLFLLPGYADMAGVLDRAARSGVQRVVQLSGMSAGSGDRTNAITEYMIASEDAVRNSRLTWTIVRPSAFASNALRWRDQLRQGNVVTEPFATIRTAVIHPGDIGAVATTALTMQGHGGAVYEISGPQAMTPADRLSVLADVLDRPLQLQPQSDDEARAAMAATMPPAYVSAFFDFYADGNLDESRVLPTLETITGRPPRTFREWAEEHAEDFAAAQ